MDRPRRANPMGGNFESFRKKKKKKKERKKKGKNFRERTSERTISFRRGSFNVPITFHSFKFQCR